MQTAMTIEEQTICGNAMTDPAYRKEIGARLKALRKQKRWSQKELADKVSLRFQQLNKYESGLNTPPVEMLVQLADALATTVDYILIGGASADKVRTDERLLKRFEALMELTKEDQETIVNVIDAMIAKARVTSAMSPVAP